MNNSIYYYRRCGTRPRRNAAAKGWKRCPAGLLGVLLSTLPCATLSGQIPTVELQALSRSVAQVGTTWELRLTGNHVEQVEGLQFTQPHITATPAAQKTSTADAPQAASSVFAVRVDPTAEAGLCEVRGVGRLGVSNPRALLLTQQPVRLVLADHAAPAAAVELTTADILLAQCQPQRRNYYRLQLAAGDTLHVVAYARQLDSQAIPSLVLEDSAGQEVARGRADGAWPAEIHQRVTHGGEYTLALNDFLYRGGAEFAYALEIATDSQEAVSQDADSQDANSQDVVAHHSAAAGGSGRELLELDQLLRPTFHRTSRLQAGGLGLVSPAVGGGLANAAQPLQTQEPVQSQDSVQTRDGAAAEQVATRDIPFTLRGQLSAASPVVCDFAARKGQRLWIEVVSAGWEQGTDPRLVLYKVMPAAETGQPPSLQRLVDQDDPPALGDVAVGAALRDPRLGWTAPEDAVYRLELRDSEAGPRPADAGHFSLTVSEPQPEFELLSYFPYPTNTPATARPMGSHLLPGGTEAIRVVALRGQDFTGAIEVVATDLPPGVSASPAVIPAAGSSADLILECTTQAASWSGPIHVEGYALADKSLRRKSHAATLLWPASTTHNAVQFRASNSLVLAVTGQPQAPLTVAVGDGSTGEVVVGEK
ncbi:MAG: hypothetical protein KDA45_14485, partial [Planctomycetales bacterium]|nr:hypothetical protein [Planctomycetales bacterium]